MKKLRVKLKKEKIYICIYRRRLYIFAYIILYKVILNYMLILQRVKIPDVCRLIFHQFFYSKLDFTILFFRKTFKM